MVVVTEGQLFMQLKKRSIIKLNLMGDKVESAGIEPASKQAIKKFSTSLDFV